MSNLIEKNVKTVKTATIDFFNNEVEEVEQIEQVEAVEATAKKTRTKKADAKTSKAKEVKAKASNNNKRNKSKKEVVTVDDKLINQLHNDLLEVLIMRREDAEQKSGAICSSIRNDIKAFSNIALTKYCLDLNIDVQFLINKLKIVDKSNSDFIALKVITKYRCAIQALAQKDFYKFDAYTQCILFNLFKNNEITISQCYASLSRNIPLSDGTQKIYRYKVTSPSTATTQACSTRMLLSHLNICEIEKNKKDDVMTFTSKKEYAKLVNAVKKMIEQSDFLERTKKRNTN